jgi:hypothetical protein
MGACGHGQIQDVSSALHDLVVALQWGEAGADGGIGGGVQHMGEGVAQREGITILDVSLQEGDLPVRAKLRIGRQKVLRVAAEHDDRCVSR